MDKYAERIIWIILYVSFIFIFLFLISFSPSNRALLGILSSLLILSVSIRLSVIYTHEKYKYIGKFLLLFDLAIVYIIILNDSLGISNLYMIILMIDSIFFYENTFGLLVIFLGYLSYLISGAYDFILFLNFKDLFLIGFVGIAAFGFLSSILYFTKYQIIQKQLIANSMKEIEEKNLKLEKAYSKLKEHSEALEEMAALEERNRIAREIHDTVGHTLTTVLIELEAGKRLLAKDKDKGLEKINLAQEQVRKGLQDIRKSVRMLREGGDVLDFIPSIELLIKDTIKHTEVNIIYNIDLKKDIPKALKKIIYNSLTEGLTNGIKHGECSSFDFKLWEHNEKVFFRLEDNGKGFKELITGFGLTVMKENVQELGGNFNVFSPENKGCIIEFQLPIKEDNL